MFSQANCRVCSSEHGMQAWAAFRYLISRKSTQKPYMLVVASLITHIEFLSEGSLGVERSCMCGITFCSLVPGRGWPQSSCLLQVVLARPPRTFLDSGRFLVGPGWDCNRVHVKLHWQPWDSACTKALPLAWPPPVYCRLYMVSCGTSEDQTWLLIPYLWIASSIN